MDIFTNLKTTLLTFSPVTNLIGSTSSTIRAWNGWQRYGQTQGQVAYPCMIVDVDNEEEQNDLLAIPQFIIAEITITCRDNTDAGCQSLHQALRTSLGGYHGTFDSILENTVHTDTPKNDGSGQHWYDRISSWTFLYGN